MKITIYELLGLIKDGKAPKKIKFKDNIYDYKEIENGTGYVRPLNLNGLEWLANRVDIDDSEVLNSEVEILDDEDEFIDIEELKIGYPEDNPSNKYIVNEYGTKCYLTKHSRIMADKINYLIKNQKKIINKLKEEGK